VEVSGGVLVATGAAVATGEARRDETAGLDRVGLAEFCPLPHAVKKTAERTMPWIRIGRSLGRAICGETAAREPKPDDRFDSALADKFGIALPPPY